MTLHELATNAVKYGALSAHAGQLSVSLEDGARQPPAAHLGGARRRRRARQRSNGFGMQLIDKGIRHNLGGDTKVDFRPTGLYVELNVPLEPARTGPKSLPAPAEFDLAAGPVLIHGEGVKHRGFQALCRRGRCLCGLGRCCVCRLGRCVRGRPPPLADIDAQRDERPEIHDFFLHMRSSKSRLSRAPPRPSGYSSTPISSLAWRRRSENSRVRLPRMVIMMLGCAAASSVQLLRPRSP